MLWLLYILLVYSPNAYSYKLKFENFLNILEDKDKGVSMIRVDYGPISETVYIDMILNTIIER